MTDFSRLARVLAEALMSPGRAGVNFGAQATNGRPPTPPVTVQATPPPIGNFQIPGMNAMPYFNPQAPAAPQAQPQMPAVSRPQMPAALPPMPPQQQVGPQAYAPGSMPPVTMGQQAPPVGQNSLERDYYAQLAANPNGFDKGWLGRLFG